MGLPAVNRCGHFTELLINLAIGLSTEFDGASVSIDVVLTNIFRVSVTSNYAEYLFFCLLSPLKLDQSLIFMTHFYHINRTLWAIH